MIQLNPTQLYAVKVPDDVIGELYVSTHNYLAEDMWSLPNRKLYANKIPFDCEILGTVKNGVIDFDAKPYCRNTESVIWLYEDFVGGLVGYDDVKSSFLSLLQANGLPIENNFVILKEK